jgi:hypothetical protein
VISPASRTKPGTGRSSHHRSPLPQSTMAVGRYEGRQRIKLDLDQTIRFAGADNGFWPFSS